MGSMISLDLLFMWERGYIGSSCGEGEGKYYILSFSTSRAACALVASRSPRHHVVFPGGTFCTSLSFRSPALSGIPPTIHSPTHFSLTDFFSFFVDYLFPTSFNNNFINDINFNNNNYNNFN